MSHRSLVSQKLARLFSLLSHPVRVRIIAELRNGQQCVSFLQRTIGATPSAISQHLAVLRTHNLIREHRQGRHVFYSLTYADMPAWLVDGIAFIIPDDIDPAILSSSAQRTRGLWLRAESDDRSQHLQQADIAGNG